MSAQTTIHHRAMAYSVCDFVEDWRQASQVVLGKDGRKHLALTPVCLAYVNTSAWNMSVTQETDRMYLPSTPSIPAPSNNRVLLLEDSMSG